MFLSSLNRFQMFSSRFRLTGVQNKCPSIPQNYFDRLFHKRTFLAKNCPCAPIKWNILHVCLLSIYSLCISAPFHLRYNWHAWCFSNVNSVSFWGIFRSSSNEIEKNLFNVGTDDFKVERRSNENASKVNLWSGLHGFVWFNFCS